MAAIHIVGEYIRVSEEGGGGGGGGEGALRWVVGHQGWGVGIVSGQVQGQKQRIKKENTYF